MKVKKTFETKRGCPTGQSIAVFGVVLMYGRKYEKQ